MYIYIYIYYQFSDGLLAIALGNACAKFDHFVRYE